MIVAFIGQPNCGKSTIFNSFSGYKANVSNFPGTTVKYTVPKLLGGFCAAHPGIDVAMVVGNREKLLQRLAGNEDDLYIMGQPPEQMDVVSEAFADNPLVLVAPPDHPQVDKKRIAPERLKCYLGRHNGIYEEPREILRSIPGLKLIEFPDNREESICCGGGSGRLWMDTKRGERFSDIRLEEAIDLGAELLAVACPYCMCMFKDSQGTINRNEPIAIKDITELIDEATS